MTGNVVFEILANYKIYCGNVSLETGVLLHDAKQTVSDDVTREQRIRSLDFDHYIVISVCGSRVLDTEWRERRATRLAAPLWMLALSSM
jgi:hypothetical protein